MLLLDLTALSICSILQIDSNAGSSGVCCSCFAGITSMTSSSSLGSSQITLQFDLNRNIDGAAQDVQAAIAKAIQQLPSTMTTPPSYRKVNPADQPVLYLSLSSEILPLSTINKYAETQ